MTTNLPISTKKNKKKPNIPLFIPSTPLSVKTSLPFRSAYGERLSVRQAFTGAGRTKQSFKDECDINQIMARYQRTGVLDFASRHEAKYGDCTGLEFQAGMELIIGAKQMFADLPSALRNRFQNEPAMFLDFIQDEGNRAEAEALGLLKVKPAAPAPKAPAAAGESAGAPPEEKKTEGKK